MNFSAIKLKFLKSKIENALSNKSKKGSLQIAKNIKTVGILVNEHSSFNFEALKKLQREIGSGSSNFQVLTYKESKENYNELRGIIFNEKDIAWNGKIKSDEINSFLNESFDMLIDYTFSNTIPKKFLATISKAKFKVGYANIDDRMYDLMINVTEDDTNKFNTELIKYLKILKKL
jgi:hypothetical protein